MQKPDATYVAGIKTWNKLEKSKEGRKRHSHFGTGFYQNSQDS